LGRRYSSHWFYSCKLNQKRSNQLKFSYKTKETNLKMPEINFQINLPDGKKASLYSPSTVILEYLKPGDSLKISDFKSLAIQALHKASEKVRAKYGFACTRTLEEEEKILSWISNYDPDQLISIFFNPNFTNFSNSLKNEFLIEVFE